MKDLTLFGAFAEFKDGLRRLFNLEPFGHDGSDTVADIAQEELVKQYGAEERYQVWNHKRQQARARLNTRFASYDRTARDHHYSKSKNAPESEAKSAHLALAALVKDILDTQDPVEAYLKTYAKTPVVLRMPIHSSRVREVILPIRDRIQPMVSNYTNRGWTDCVWDREPWFRDNLRARFIHMPHVSEKDPNLIAFHATNDKFMRDIQTQIKPGKYLQTYFGDVLSPDQIRMWAEKQAYANKPLEVQFIQNDDPKGWVWVYENGPMSCMRYNRSGRYIDRGLNGEYHPVNVYAREGNGLALAFAMKPGSQYNRDYECDQDESIVAARAIVNLNNKTYVRIYAEDEGGTKRKFQDQLEALGYSWDSGALRGVEVNRIGHPDDCDKIVMPYLDGYADEISVCDDYLIIVRDGDVGGCDSSGCVEYESTVCECCGDRTDREDLEMTADESYVCQDCLDRFYRWAMGRREEAYFRDEDVIECETDGEWYATEYAYIHNVYQCEYSGDWYHLDDLVPTSSGYVNRDDAVSLDFADSERNDYAYPGDEYELPDGRYCHKDNKDEILAEHYADEEDEIALAA